MNTRHTQQPLGAPVAALAPARPVTLRVNGQSHALPLAPWTTLLDALREYPDLTGTKKGCDHGQCGARTVLVDGKRINSCLSLAVMREGDDIQTIEGSGTEEHLHPLQQAFIDHDAFQCGYCTPGPSRFEDFTEVVVNWSGLVYRCANVQLGYQLARIDACTPIDMRATGSFALGSALDELAYKAGVDPLDFQLLNYAERDQSEDKPFSSKKLRECCHQRAAKFGWGQRPHEPRSMREGNLLVGWGVATGCWDASQQKAAAKAGLTADGRLTVSSASNEIGTGTCTIMTQIAARTLGLPLDAVTFVLGGTALPEAPVQGGSWTAAPVGSAVQSVCQAVAKKVLRLAQQMDDPPLEGVDFEEVQFVDGQIRRNDDLTQSVVIRGVLQASGEPTGEAQAGAQPDTAKQLPYYRRGAGGRKRTTS